MSRRKVRFEDLQDGMLTTRGLIVDTKTIKLDGIYGSKNYITFYDRDDPYWGKCSSSTILDTMFEIVHEVGTEEYVKEVRFMIEERTKALEDTKADIKCLEGCLKLTGLHADNNVSGKNTPWTDKGK